MKMNNKEENTLSIFCVDTISMSTALRSIVQQNFGREVRTSLQELGEILKSIQKRVISESYIINNGKCSKK